MLFFFPIPVLQKFVFIPTCLSISLSLISCLFLTLAICLFLVYLFLFSLSITLLLSHFYSFILYFSRLLSTVLSVSPFLPFSSVYYTASNYLSVSLFSYICLSLLRSFLCTSFFYFSLNHSLILFLYLHIFISICSFHLSFVSLFSILFHLFCLSATFLLSSSFSALFTCFSLSITLLISVPLSLFLAFSYVSI